eukprot:jgi/Chrzof1/4799/UNPLg00803.t1
MDHDMYPRLPMLASTPMPLAALLTRPIRISTRTLYSCYTPVIRGASLLHALRASYHIYLFIMLATETHAAFTNCPNIHDANSYNLNFNNTQGNQLLAAEVLILYIILFQNSIIYSITSHPVIYY